MPSWPVSQVDTDGISRVLVHEQNRTAPISPGSRPAWVHRDCKPVGPEQVQRHVAHQLEPGG
jgi:hypothetical protein